MKISKVRIHNYRSIVETEVEIGNFCLLVGPNNSGKSTFVNAIRAFYDELKWAPSDMPHQGRADHESWVEITFELTPEEFSNLAENYRSGDSMLTLRRYFKSENRVKPNQSNIYAVKNGEIDDTLFYGARNVGSAKIGTVVYIPALTTPEEQTKTSGPSPLRNTLNFVLKRVLEKNAAYHNLTKAVDDFGAETKKQNGLLGEITGPINDSLRNWGVSMGFDCGSISPEDITRSLLKFQFVDEQTNGTPSVLAAFGHGFQRAVIYELIKLASRMKDERKAAKKEFDPEFNLILFEEPEAFLHPDQQEEMAYNLRSISVGHAEQVVITTHSPIFVGRSSSAIRDIIRVYRESGVTRMFQISREQLSRLFDANQRLTDLLEGIHADPRSSPKTRKSAEDALRELIRTEEDRESHEHFRFQLALNYERSALFFSSAVLLVEGLTEKTLVNHLLGGDWFDLKRRKVFVVEVNGKFNFHRYMELLKCFGIPHGVLYDCDPEGSYLHHLNVLIADSKNEFTMADPQELVHNLEEFLGLEIPCRNELKPVRILMAVSHRQIASSKLDALKLKVESALGFHHDLL